MTEPVYTHPSREAWLLSLVEELRPWYEEVGITVPPVRISVGFSSKGARSKVIGECWHPESTDDGVPQVFIHPAYNDPAAVAPIVVHELVHAGIGPGKKHGPEFRRPAVALGLEGRMTATVPGAALLERLAPVLEELGPYPHGALRPGGQATSAGPKQTTRMKKVTCLACGYVARTTQKWLDEVGAPVCPADMIPMEVA